MAQTTFSGPILAGGIKNTTGTVVGTNVKNTGQVLMAQSFSLAPSLTVPDLIGPLKVVIAILISS